MPRHLFWTVCAAALAAAWALDASAAVAQVYRLRVVSAECTPAGCRLRTAACSAVAIGRHRRGREIFLSAGHCVRGSVHSVAVELGGTWHAADVLAVSRSPGDDLAVLGVRYQGNVECAPVAERASVPGNEVRLQSFPNGGALRRRAGRIAVHRYVGVDLVVDVATTPGESGGAILDTRGRLVGIISATGPLPVPNHTLATGVVGMRELLSETFAAGVPKCGQTSGDSNDQQPGAERPASTPGAGQPGRDTEGSAEAPAEAEVGADGGNADEAQCRCPPGGGSSSEQLPELAAEIDRLRARLSDLEQRQIPVQVLAADGRVIDERRVPLGEPIQLRLVPLRRRDTR